jgi:hypothetical protein
MATPEYSDTESIDEFPPPYESIVDVFEENKRKIFLEYAKTISLVGLGIGIFTIMLVIISVNK